MNNAKFKPLMLLALLFPLLGAGLGYMLYGPGIQKGSPVVSSVRASKPGDPVLVYGPEDQLPVREARAPGSLELGIYLALVCGAVALLYHYLNRPLAWIAVILLALAFALLFHKPTGLPLTGFFLINLVLGAMLTLLVKYLFFLKALVRWRMIITTMLGAGLIALYFRGLFWLTKTEFESGFWSAYFVNGILLFVFIAFGLSLADMLVQRAEIAQLRASQVSEEDEDA